MQASTQLQLLNLVLTKIDYRVLAAALYTLSSDRRIKRWWADVSNEILGFLNIPSAQDRITLARYEGFDTTNYDMRTLLVIVFVIIMLLGLGSTPSRVAIVNVLKKIMNARRPRTSQRRLSPQSHSNSNSNILENAERADRRMPARTALTALSQGSVNVKTKSREISEGPGSQGRARATVKNSPNSSPHSEDSVTQKKSRARTHT